MAKQNKKKNTALASWDKAFAKACNLPNGSPSETRGYIQQVRSATKRMISLFGFQDSLVIQPADTVDAIRQVEHLKQPQHFDEYVSVARSLILGHWLSKKRVFVIMPETVAFLESHGYDHFPADYMKVLKDLCAEPIYLEFPKQESLTGAFVGVTTLQNDRSKVTNTDLTNFMMVLSNHEDGCHLEIGGWNKHSIKDILSSSEPLQSEGINVDIHEAAKMKRLIIMSIAYIWYMALMKDSDKEILVESEKNQLEEYISVYPISEHHPFPNFQETGSWLANGLCQFNQYLSREQMVEEFQADIRDHQQEYGSHALEDHRFPLKLLDQHDFLFLKHKQSVLDWEKNRIVYQYNEATMEKLFPKYAEEIRSHGFPSRLLQYLPYSSILIAHKEYDWYYLLSECKTDTKSGKGLYMMAGSYLEMNPMILAMDQVPMIHLSTRHNPSDVLQEFEHYFLVGLVCLYHILSTIERTTMKRIERAKEKDHPEPTTVRKDRPHTEAVLSYPEADQGIRYASPLVMYDLTERTVKRVREQEAERRSGYKMVPHHRRRHAHHYWVGSGAEKHLEVRWIEDIQVHGKESSSSQTTIKAIR